MKEKILVLEDEIGIRSFVSINLKREGYEIIEAGTGAEAIEKINENNDISIALLDVMLPDISGIEVCKYIRQKFDQVGIIMLTAKAQEEDKLEGFISGADDYIVKPFLTSEFVLRVTAVLKRTYKPVIKNTDIKLSDRVINLETASVKFREEEIPLTAKEFIILKKLYENKNRIVTYDALCLAAWGDGYYGYENTLMVHIRRLREKIETDPSKPKHIITVKGLGYKLEVSDNE